MSANIHWKPFTPDSSKTLAQAGAPSHFIEAMKKAFGNFPCTVGQNEIEKLKGMAATDRDDNNPFQEIIDLLEHHEAIYLWAEY